MQSTDIPGKLPIPFGFAASGSFIRPIPVNSQIGVTDGAASLHDGFVPLNATPIAGGGVPPDIRDMNGILNEISAWARWQAAGGPVYFDPDFSTAVGGYPLDAKLDSAVTAGVLFVSKIENNTTNPDIDPTNWVTINTAYHTNFATGERTSPDGYIEKWGLATWPPSGSFYSNTVPFVTPFPNACFGCNGTPQKGGAFGWAPVVLMIEQPPPLDHFVFSVDTARDGKNLTGGTFAWYARGH